MGVLCVCAGGRAGGLACARGKVATYRLPYGYVRSWSGVCVCGTTLLPAGKESGRRQLTTYPSLSLSLFLTHTHFLSLLLACWGEGEGKRRARGFIWLAMSKGGDVSVLVHLLSRFVLGSVLAFVDVHILRSLL